VCRTRKNSGGRLESLVYAKLAAVNIDPVEKKPLFHFLPKTPTLSVAAPGCNLRCVFCQNWEISQVEPSEVATKEVSPEELVSLAKERGCPSISYTYSEPTAYYDYVLDTSMLARKEGVRNVLVSCGYMNPGPARELSGFLDAANVDLKGFTDNTYRWVAGAKLAPALETLKILKEKGVWLEVGYLVIPTVNDSQGELKTMAQWTVKNLGPDVPVHFLRFFPQHKLTGLPPTPVKKLEEACAIARAAGMNFVYIGNVPGSKYEDTYCPRCKKMIISRKGSFTEEIKLKDGRCDFCGRKIPGVWK
jgi:pyruvate formate lyase activating enzyme